MRASKGASLLRMRLLAASALAAAAVLFGLGAWLERACHPAWSYLTAFAEAAMVGGLADWFAVVALFRHPMGIPLWHTAIVPRSKDRFGEALGLFVTENFLADHVVSPRIARIDLAARLADWLAANHGIIAARAVRLLPRALATLDNARIGPFLARLAMEHLEALPAAPMAAQALDAMAADGRHRDILVQLARWLASWARRNEGALAAEIEPEVPLPPLAVLRPARAAVASYLEGKIQRKLQELPGELEADPGHPLHERFRLFIAERVAALRDCPALREDGERLKRAILDSSGAAACLESLWGAARARLLADAARPDSSVRRVLSEIAAWAADGLRQDSSLRAHVNTWMRAALREAVAANRAEAAALIAETVRQWDAKEAADRLELEVGADLQFIRINGAVVGGLAGVAIHAIRHLLF